MARTDRPDLLGAALVAVCGGLWLMAVLGALTVGPLFALPALVVSVLLVTRVARRRSGWSALAGLAATVSVLPLWFAYLVVGHPGLPDLPADGEGLPSLAVLLAAAAVPVLVSTAVLAVLWVARVR